jgi:hypothetical protein
MPALTRRLTRGALQHEVVQLPHNLLALGREFHAEGWVPLDA